MNKPNDLKITVSDEHGLVLEQWTLSEAITNFVDDLDENEQVPATLVQYEAFREMMDDVFSFAKFRLPEIP